MWPASTNFLHELAEPRELASLQLKAWFPPLQQQLVWAEARVFLSWRPQPVLARLQALSCNPPKGYLQPSTCPILPSSCLSPIGARKSGRATFFYSIPCSRAQLRSSLATYFPPESCERGFPNIPFAEALE